MTFKFTSAILASVATLVAGGALAADLPSSVRAPAPYIAPLPVFTWTGFYVGVNAGAAFGNGNNPSFSPSDGLPGSTTLNPDAGSRTAFTGGVQAGYNWQMSQFVFGVEGDIDYIGKTNRLNGTYASPAFYSSYPAYSVSGARNDDVYGTIRGRVGYAVDRALFYVTGGVAFGGSRAPSSVAFQDSTGAVCSTCTFSSTGNSHSNVGGVIGGGVEYAFLPNWTAKVEYLHTFYGKKNVTYSNGESYDGVAQTFTVKGNDLDTNIARVGVNYKF